MQLYAVIPFREIAPWTQMNKRWHRSRPRRSPRRPLPSPAWWPPRLHRTQKRSYEAALKRLDAALEGQDLTDASLSVYLASLHAAGLSPAVASMAVAAVKFRCRLQGLASPVGPATDRVLAGLRRKGKGRGRGQVDGVRFSEVDTAAAVAANDSGSVAGLRDAALLAVASDGLLRVSEVAALDVGDVQAEADGSGRLLVGESKTDQEGRGVVLYLGAPTVKRVNAWLDAAGHQDGPLFRRVRRGGRVEGDPGRRLSVNAIRQIIRSRAAAVGIEGRVSGHSLRVGGAQSLADGGASLVEMQTAGRWQSPAMPGHYARGQLAARGAVARIRYGRG